MTSPNDLEILLVDDDKPTREYLSTVLRNENYRITVANGVNEARDLLQTRSFALVISDLRLDNEEGTVLIPFVKQVRPICLIIFITGFASMDSAVKALHDGAFDYISKTADLHDLEGDLKTVVSRALKQREVLIARGTDPVVAPTQSTERHIVGSSPAMARIYRDIAKASLTRENVLITGESGTGKELVAHAIHEKSPWSTKPFVTVNCCALTETLLESELFGHVRGAFTGAMKSKKGLFEEADGGTLFLDEIGDISLALQVKLLRAIQEGEIKPVGSNDVIRVDVRLIAATHRDLQKRVVEGLFREDLFYRLKVISIDVPPLRDRRDDLPDLIQYFINRYAQKTARAINSISDEAMDFLLNYQWPGNIRELENAIGRAAAMANSSMLFPEDFPGEVTQFHEAVQSPSALSSLPVEPSQTIPMANESLESLEKKHIARTLESVNFNKSKAAEILGIDRVTLYRKAFKYGILSKGVRNTTTAR